MATAIPGNTVSVASASRQSTKNRTTADPISVIVFWTSVVGPSVTSEFERLDVVGQPGDDDAGRVRS